MTSRLESMEAVVRDNLDNPLDDNTMVTQQLEQMATIGRLAPSPCPSALPHRVSSGLCRCEYSKTCQLLISLFDSSASAYQTLLQSPSPSPQELALREGQLTWLVYLIGSVIGGRISHTNADHYDSMDGQLVCR